MGERSKKGKGKMVGSHMLFSLSFKEGLSRCSCVVVCAAEQLFFFANGFWGTKSALFNFQSLLLALLLLICTSAYAHYVFPGIMDRNRDG